MLTKTTSILQVFCKKATVCNTAWCSILEVIIRFTPKLVTALCKIRLSASVPPAVKIISAADAFNRLAMFLDRKSVV